MAKPGSSSSSARNHLGPGLERQLHAEDLGVRVPVHEEGVPPLHLGVGDLERVGLVGLGREQDVLPRAVGGLLPLLEARHKPVARRGVFPPGDLRVLYLEQQRPLVLFGVELLGHSIPWPPDLDPPLFHGHRRPGGHDLLPGGPRGLPRGPLGQVALVPSPLRVRQVAALALVDRQAQAALVLPQVVAHEVWVLRDVYRLEGEAAEALAAVDVLLGVGGGEGGGRKVVGEQARKGRLRRSRSRRKKKTNRPSGAGGGGGGDADNKSLTSCAADVCPPVPGLEPCSLAAMNDILRRK